LCTALRLLGAPLLLARRCPLLLRRSAQLLGRVVQLIRGPPQLLGNLLRVLRRLAGLPALLRIRRAAAGRALPALELCGRALRSNEVVLRGIHAAVTRDIDLSPGGDQLGVALRLRLIETLIAVTIELPHFLICASA